MTTTNVAPARRRAAEGQTERELRARWQCRDGTLVALWALA